MSDKKESNLNQPEESAAEDQTRELDLAENDEELILDADETAEAPENEIARLQNDLADARDKILRARAEFDNYRKRMQRDIADARTAARIGTIEDILPVVDHFQMAMNHANEKGDYATLKQGMDMILMELERVFENLGIEKIPTVGETFDPNLHEAISTQPSEEAAEGVILSEWKSGYRLGDRVLRAPSVVVSSGPAQETEND